MAFITRDDTSLLRMYVKGTLTGAVETALVYPTEFVKTQLQLQVPQSMRCARSAKHTDGCYEATPRRRAGARQQLQRSTKAASSL
jgi:hypothetical protein